MEEKSGTRPAQTARGKNRVLTATKNCVLAILAVTFAATGILTRQMSVLAANDPVAAISRAESVQGSQNWDGLCEAFVEWSFNVSNYASTAWELYQRLGQPNRGTDPSSVPRGALVFYSPAPENGYAGHVGIAEGQGRLISAQTNGVTINSITNLVTYDSSVAGWSWPPTSWVTPVAQPANGGLIRYYNGQEHFVTSGTVTSDYKFEQNFGLLSTIGLSNTRPIYSCLVGGWDHMLSNQPNCEGTQVLGGSPIGYAYTSPVPGFPASPIYRCYVRANGDHFVSSSATCEGQPRDYLLGYTIPQSALLRYYNGQDHYITTARVTVGYDFEQELGFMPLVQLPNTTPLYSCLVGGWDHMLSIWSNCEGAQVVGLAPIGYVFNSPPVRRPYKAIYRCYVSGTGDHFVSIYSNCEGQRVEGLLGYTTTQPG